MFFINFFKQREKWQKQLLGIPTDSVDKDRVYRGLFRQNGL